MDVQVGQQMYEGMPQELRARLWFVLLENPHLVDPLKVGVCLLGSAQCVSRDQHMRSHTFDLVLTETSDRWLALRFRCISVVIE